MSRTRTHCIIKKVLPNIQPDEIDEELKSLTYEINIKSEISATRRSLKISEQDMLKINKPVYSNKPKEYATNTNKVNLLNTAYIFQRKS
jgi:hypothetical protein